MRFPNHTCFSCPWIYNICNHPFTYQNKNHIFQHTSYNTQDTQVHIWPEYKWQLTSFKQQLTTDLTERCAARTLLSGENFMEIISPRSSILKIYNQTSEMILFIIDLLPGVITTWTHICTGAGWTCAIFWMLYYIYNTDHLYLSAMSKKESQGQRVNKLSQHSATLSS